MPPPIRGAKRRAASTGRLYIRILELEPGALQTFDVIDLGTDEIHEAHLVDDALDPLDLKLTIDLGRLVEIEVVREPGAAAANHAKAQRHGVLDALGRTDL